MGAVSALRGWGFLLWVFAGWVVGPLVGDPLLVVFACAVAGIFGPDVRSLR